VAGRRNLNGTLRLADDSHGQAIQLCAPGRDATGRDCDDGDDPPMSDLVQKLLQASEWSEIVDLAREICARDDPSDVPSLIAALKNPIEARRWGAVYALCSSRRDRQAVRPLIEVLLDREETPRVRGQVAECIGKLGGRRVLRSLVECSTDDSSEVRFWCVFAIGQWRRPWGRRRHKPPFLIIRALEARLEDNESPESRGYWPIRLEALAMLYLTGVRHAAREVFQETMLTVLRDPLRDAADWRWASWYWDCWSENRFDQDSRLEANRLFDSAVQAIHRAGSIRHALVMRAEEFSLASARRDSCLLPTCRALRRRHSSGAGHKRRWPLLPIPDRRRALRSAPQR
jgi:hypothetical protein